MNGTEVVAPTTHYPSKPSASTTKPEDMKNEQKEKTHSTQCPFSHRVGKCYCLYGIVERQDSILLVIIYESLFLYLGYGITWLCRWNIDIFFLLAAIFGVVFPIILCYRPKKVSLFIFSNLVWQDKIIFYV